MTDTPDSRARPQVAPGPAASACGARRRGPRTILQSGGIGPDELARDAAEFGAVAVLELPFSVGPLVAAVRRAIEG